MKKWYLLIIIILSASCHDDGDVVIIDPPEPEETFITLTVQVPGIKAPSSYSSLEEADENLITDLDILAFQNTENGEVLSYRIAVSQESITEIPDGSAGVKKVIKLMLKRTIYPVRLMVIANARSSLDNLNNASLLEEGISKTLIMESLTFPGDLYQDLVDFKGFPMVGQTSQYIPTNVEVIPTIGTVNLLRSVAKIDIGVDFYSDPALGFGQIFTIDSVLIFRVNDIGYMAPEEAAYGNSQVTTTHIPPQAVHFTEPLRYEYKANYDPIYKINAMQRRMYVPESDTYGTGDEDKMTCLVLAARYKDSPVSYYRVDFTDKDRNLLPLLRNHRYLINISNIKGNGYPTAEAAALARSSSLEYHLQVLNENIGDIIYTPENMLGISNAEVKIDWAPDSKAIVYVLTDYKFGWNAYTQEDWLTVDMEDNEQPDQEGKLIITATQNSRELLRTGKIYITAGMLTHEVTVKQGLGANSYIISPNSKLRIPVASANRGGVIRVNENTGFKVQIIWDDRNPIYYTYGKTGTGVTGWINFWPHDYTGNTIIGITDNSGNLLYSWHVWVTDYNPELEQNQQKNKEIIFMDRNLGAINNNITWNYQSYGLMYQWGRKDPFPYPWDNHSNGTNENFFSSYLEVYPIDVDSISIPNSSGIKKDREILLERTRESVTIETTIQNPYTFYYTQTAPYNWIGGNKLNNTLWMDSDGRKGPYDPCPEGWRVPPADTNRGNPWTGINPESYYPTAGGRAYDSGLFMDVESNGFVWSASPNGTGATALRFGIDGTNRQASMLRANAFPVRCIKDK